MPTNALHVMIKLPSKVGLDLRCLFAILSDEKHLPLIIDKIRRCNQPGLPLSGYFNEDSLQRIHQAAAKLAAACITRLTHPIYNLEEWSSIKIDPHSHGKLLKNDFPNSSRIDVSG